MIRLMIILAILPLTAACGDFHSGSDYCGLYTEKIDNSDKGEVFALLEMCENSKVLVCAIDFKNESIEHLLTVSEDYRVFNVLSFQNNLPEDSDDRMEIIDVKNKLLYWWNNERSEYQVFYRFKEVTDDPGAFRFHGDSDGFSYLLFYEDGILYTFKHESFDVATKYLETEIDDEPDYFIDFDKDERIDFIWARLGKTALSSSEYAVQNLPTRFLNDHSTVNGQVRSVEDSKILYYHNGKILYRYMELPQQFRLKIQQSMNESHKLANSIFILFLVILWIFQLDRLDSVNSRNVLIFKPILGILALGIASILVLVCFFTDLEMIQILFILPLVTLICHIEGENTKAEILINAVFVLVAAIITYLAYFGFWLPRVFG